MLKNTLFYLMFCLITCVQVRADEQREIDSLELLLKNKSAGIYLEPLKDVKGIDTSEIKILLRLSELYRENNLNKAIDYTAIAYIISKKINYKLGIAKSLNSKASNYYYQSNYEESNKTYLEAIAYCKKHALFELMVKSYKDLGSNYIELGKYPDDYSNYMLALRAVEKHHLTKRKAEIRVSLGLFYYYQQKLDSALLYIKKAQEIFIHNNNSKEVMRTNFYIGAIYFA